MLYMGLLIPGHHSGSSRYRAYMHRQVETQIRSPLLEWHFPEVIFLRTSPSSFLGLLPSAELLVADIEGLPDCFGEEHSVAAASRHRVASGISNADLSDDRGHE